MAVTLFDDRERTYTGPALHREPTYHWLNRSADENVARVRKTLKQWFAHYPEEERANLRARFRSSTKVQHVAAAFELLLHDALLALNCDVTVHPETKARVDARPDFLAELPNGELFYLAATLLTGKSDEERGAEQRKTEDYDPLDELESENFWLGVRERGVPAEPPPTTEMRGFLQEKMRELDPDEVGATIEERGFDAAPRWDFEL